MKHIPGPWLESEEYITAGSYTIARIFPGTGQDAANARLIAAAPDLLKACQEMVEYRISQISPNSFGCNECREVARKRGTIPHREFCRVGKAEAAIAKAEGQNANS